MALLCSAHDLLCSVCGQIYTVVALMILTCLLLSSPSTPILVLLFHQCAPSLDVCSPHYCLSFAFAFEVHSVSLWGFSLFSQFFCHVPFTQPFPLPFSFHNRALFCFSSMSVLSLHFLFYLFASKQPCGSASAALYSTLLLLLLLFHRFPHPYFTFCVMKLSSTPISLLSFTYSSFLPTLSPSNRPSTCVLTTSKTSGTVCSSSHTAYSSCISSMWSCLLMSSSSVNSRPRLVSLSSAASYFPYSRLSPSSIIVSICSYYLYSYYICSYYIGSYYLRMP